jgi:uncharacterized protein (DUF4415 family)
MPATATKMKRPPKDGVPDEENPEWTLERMRNAMSYPNLPPELMRIIEADKKKRGAQKAPKKEAISIRLSSDVLDALRATGPGWQGRADEILRAQLVAKQ